MKNWILLVAFILLTKSAFALVEYDDEYVGDKVSNTASAPKRVSKTSRNFRPTGAGPSRSIIHGLEFRANYDSIGLELDSQASTKAKREDIQKYNVGLTLLTAYDAYLDISYWQAKSSEQDATKNLKNSGNAKYTLGFNWFKGTGENPVQANIYLSHIQGQKQSTLASSRNDQVIGLETSKRIKKVVLGIGAEHRMTGTPKNSDEVAIGNISKLSAGLAWLVSNDIKFSFEANSYKVKSNDNEGVVNKLEDDISFSVFVPKLHLQIFKSVEMVLGATVRTNRPEFKDEDGVDSFVGARLLDIPGAYGNSVFTGFNFTFL